jgi:hypothetical protein
MRGDAKRGRKGRRGGKGVREVEERREGNTELGETTKQE